MSKNKSRVYLTKQDEKTAKTANAQSLIPKLTERIRSLQDGFENIHRQNSRLKKPSPDLIAQAKAVQAFAEGFVVRLNNAQQAAGYQGPEVALETLWRGSTLYPGVKPTIVERSGKSETIHYSEEAKEAQRREDERYRRLTKRAPMNVSAASEKKLAALSSVIPERPFSRPNPFKFSEKASKKEKIQKLGLSIAAELRWAKHHLAKRRNERASQKMGAYAHSTAAARENLRLAKNARRQMRELKGGGSSPFPRGSKPRPRVRRAGK